MSDGVSKLPVICILWLFWLVGIAVVCIMQAIRLTVTYEMCTARYLFQWRCQTSMPKNDIFLKHTMRAT